MFDIKESPINKTFEGESLSKKFCSQHFLYQPSLLFLGFKRIHENIFKILSKNISNIPIS